ncbi:dimethylarginine dimethylaminohydrolase family protein [Lactobacillus jensenii]|jgi:amidinotransferase|uniref:Nitrate reductase n=1 Tax=Lactobacillus jensenii TaxID=109790 RepID=A0A5N1I456_LACJE|nr:dimethylarginine dimethylaminohydrolase family protein [Lactobacillus jensenii]KAA9319978.1 nitrate reductase [Lactobacillus jensenii]MDK6811876.1 dimethylarginine dimethylaminohydrolase family protein [Lactobacillus jensenii]MDK8616292.1 dimethylarginine dimethylaminohydrolase family protein [Lactobacillus jensenii]NJJ52362.1 nitrate reductase [Lactobacillus jensenii]
MTEKVYVRNATNELKKVIVCSPKFYKFNGINEITKSWMEKGEKEHNELMVKEWQTLIDAYKENGVEVVEMEPQPELEVQTFARDFGAMIKEDAIIGKFRHPARQKETAVYEAKLKELGIPIVARCNAGCFEGGDFWMIDEHTLAFGLVDRTDQAGVDNLREQLQKFGYTVVGVPVAPEHLHLDMCFNIVAPKVCLATKSVLPFWFLRMLERRGFNIIDVPEELIAKHGCNVQALGKNKVLGIANNVSVNEKLEAAGVEVIKLPLEQILKAGGGPHCMTYPVQRS